MNGHVRKRGSKWEVVLELGEQATQRCPVCVDTRGRGRRHWADKGRLDACPTCGGDMDDLRARRQIVLLERYRTKKQAGEALTRQLHADLTGAFVEPDKLTVGEYLVDHWLPSIVESVRPATLISYSGHVTAHIVPLLGDVPLRKLTPTAINAFHATLRVQPRRPRGRSNDLTSSDLPPDSVAAPSPLSERTRLHIHVTLNAALNAAVDAGLIAVNPAKRAKAPGPRRRDVGELHTWSRTEVQQFLEATRDDRLLPLWRLLVATGIRRGEALGLKWSDVDMEASRVSIQRTRVMVGYDVREQPPKTERSRRAVALDAGTLALLRSWRARQSAERLEWGAAYSVSDWVFTNERGEPLHPDRVTKLFAAAVIDAKVPRIRLHDLRHTSATLALAAGLHPKVVQERLGHSTISQTLDTYSHTTKSLHEGAAAKLGDIIDGA